MTLKEQIAAANRELAIKRAVVKAAEEQLRLLENSRADCEHEWDGGIKGWEHEGCYCVKCGINDQYAPNHKRMIEAERKFRKETV